MSGHDFAFSRLKFIVRAPIMGPVYSADAVAKVCVESERLGYYGISVADWGVHQDADISMAYTSTGGVLEVRNKSQNPNLAETMVALSFAAGLTKEVKLLTSATVLPLRNPIWTAKQIATLDDLSNGRVIFGVCPGTYIAVIMAKQFESIGAPYDERRGEMTDEYIRVCKEIWTNPISSFNGKYVKFSGIQIYPKPKQKPYPPIWIAGNGRRALRRTAELGDGWIPSNRSAEDFRQGGETIRQLAQKYETGHKAFALAGEMFACIARTREEAWSMVRTSMEASFSTAGVKDIPARVLVGSPDDLIKRVEEYLEAGVGYLELRFQYRNLGEMLQMMEMWASEVSPSF